METNLKTYQVKLKLLKKIALDQGLYAQVVMILRRESDGIKEKDMTKVYNFQGKSARTKLWFNLDREWLKEKFITREPDFYKNTIRY